MLVGKCIQDVEVKWDLADIDQLWGTGQVTLLVSEGTNWVRDNGQMSRWEASVGQLNGGPESRLGSCTEGTISFSSWHREDWHACPGFLPALHPFPEGQCEGQRGTSGDVWADAPICACVRKAGLVCSWEHQTPPTMSLGSSSSLDRVGQVGSPGQESPDSKTQSLMHTHMHQNLLWGFLPCCHCSNLCELYPSALDHNPLPFQVWGS